MVRYFCASGILLSQLILGCSPRTGPSADVSRPPSTTPQSSQITQPIVEPVDDPVVATAGKTVIRESELLVPLKQAYGLNILMYVVQRDLAMDVVREMGLTVTESDIAQERDWTLRQSFPKAETPEEREKLLDQLLNQPKPRENMMSRTEFDIMMQTNAAMRKIAQTSFKDAISEEQLKQQFDRQYGASVKVRFIMLANIQEVQKVQRMLAAGEDFAEVARRESRDPQTRALGGELPPFTVNDTRLPETFREVAFSLKEGEVSDAVQAGGSYHLIKLEQRIPPKAVKYEDVKDSLRESIRDQMVIEAFKEIRNRLAQQALATLKIDDPVLKRAFEQKLAERDQLIREKDKIREELQKQRQMSATTAPAPASVTPPGTNPVAEAPPGASTIPSTIPTTAPTTVPASQP